MEQKDTPIVLVDYEKLTQNIGAMQNKALTNGLALRPHAKTHKCAEIAQLQLRYGACGITASRAEEALFFLRSGCRSVTIAYPMLSQRRLDILLRTAEEKDAQVQFIVDSEEGMAALGEAAASYSNTCGVFVKIDTGLHRCGLREHDKRIEHFARQLEATPGMRFAGLLSHAGHAYAAGSPDEIRLIAEDERRQLLHITERLTQSSIAVREISAGCTPAALASPTFEGLTELRPGNYVFLDGTQVRLGVCTTGDVSLSVLATVVSCNDQYYIVDAGSKTLSSDLGAHGTAAVSTYGTAYPFEHYGDERYEIPIVRLSEEHGFLRRTGVRLAVGDRVRIIPNHACVVANLAAQFYMVHENQIVDIWQTGARSMH